MKKQSFIFHIFLCFFAIGLSNCVNVTSDAERQKLSKLFTAPNTLIGETVTVQGHLRYVSHNRNLFPSASWESERPGAVCLPVLIKSTDVVLIEAATRLDRSDVEVTGKIVQIAKPGMIVISTCKDVGIEILDLRAR